MFHNLQKRGGDWFAYDKIMDTVNQTSWSLKKRLRKCWYKSDRILGLNTFFLILYRMTEILPLY
jgi:hypothetical protein